MEDIKTFLNENKFKGEPLSEDDIIGIYLNKECDFANLKYIFSKMTKEKLKNLNLFFYVFVDDNKFNLYKKLFKDFLFAPNAGKSWVIPPVNNPNLESDIFNYINSIICFESQKSFFEKKSKKVLLADEGSFVMSFKDRIELLT